MEFPTGGHHHHHRNDPEEDERRERPPPYYPQPPPPTFFGNPSPPPPPYFHENEHAPPPPYHKESHVSHVSHSSERPSDFDSFNHQQPPPRQNYPESHVTHVGHASDRPEGFASFDYQHQQPPPRPNYPESNVTHVSHASDRPEGFASFNYQHQQPPPPPPRPEPAVHVSHVSHEQTETTHHHSFKPHLPSFLHHHSESLSGKPSVRFFCKAEPNFSLTIRDGKVVLALSDTADVFQHWYKDEKYSTRVKDEEGFPAFALVNRATGQAMKHSIGATHPVQLIPYNPDVLDESILWTESKDIGDGYRAVRMVNNIRLNVDAFHGDKKSGGVHDGTTIVLWQWNKGDNQRWKILPY